MDSLPNDLRGVPFHTMGCPDDCALCTGADEIERLRTKVEELTSATCTWKKIDGMRAYKMCKGGISQTNYLTPYCPNCGRRVVEQEGE